MNEIQLKIADVILADFYSHRPLFIPVTDYHFIAERINLNPDDISSGDIFFVRDVFLKEGLLTESPMEVQSEWLKGFTIDLKGIELQQKFGSYSAYYKSEQKKNRRAEKRETVGYRIKVIGFYVSTTLLILSFAFNIYQALNKK